ncbi:MAG: hypothetical protein ASARMPRED_009181 [Alectoria sarmentosa]|nr:MAG: hypothetical protein ASARMPRED_009181 [Alectoria sarmentosa]
MGVFDLVPNLLSSIITILFPIFASYKALRTSDPAQLTPWLMYWVVLSCFLLVESWTWFILAWLPFYSSLRLLLLCYLVLPQTQGAKLIYQTHIHPFLAHHEHDIDNLIISAHDRAKSAGLTYLKRAIEFVKENLLGIQPKASSQTTPSQGGNYAQSLLSRFNLPSAREGLAAPAGDFYGLLSAALGTISATGGTSREVQAEDLSRSGTLIPQGMTSASEKMTFLSTQRERLRVLLSALDKEADGLGTEAAIERDVEKRLTGEQLGEGLKKSRSEAEFEEIGKDDLKGEGAKPQGSGWLPWAWGAKGKSGNVAKGKTSGIDAG